MALSNPHHHIVSYSNEWPTAINILAQNLNKHLSIPQSSGLSHNIPAITQHLMANQHAQDPTLTPEAGKNDLSSALGATLALLTQLDAKTPAWQSLLTCLLSTLCRLLYQDSHILLDVPFYLARTQHNLDSFYDRGTMVDGQALFIGSRCSNSLNWHTWGTEPEILPPRPGGCAIYHAPSTDSEFSFEEDSESSVSYTGELSGNTTSDEADGDENGEVETSTSENDESQSGETGTYDSESDESQCYEDYEDYARTQIRPPAWYPRLPFDSYIVPDSPFKRSMELPFFVASDPDYLIQLMTSILYQRYTWCIDAPLVGLEILSGSPVVRTHIGWLEYHGDEAPAVHISRAARETKSSPALGIYDMTNPLDSWAFVQFILSLQDQVNAIASVMGAPEVRDFCWRLDHVNPIADIDNNRYHRSVVHWLSRCPSQFEDAPLSSSASDMPYDGSEEHFQIALKPLLIRDWGWDMLTSDVPSSKSVLFERWVEIIPLAVPSREFTSYNTIRSMISLYDDLTKLSFLPKWNFENPNTDAKRSVFLRPKLNQLLMCHNEKLGLVQSESRSHVLDNDLAAIVEDRLDLILLPTTWNTLTDTGCHHNERIDRHHIWNLLVTSFYVGHDEVIGRDIRFDVDIRLSRNRLTDLLQDTANQNQPLVNVKTTVDLFAHNMTRRAWDYIERETRYYMYVNAVRVKREEERAWANEDRDYACCSWSRSTQEPLYGTCDIVTLRHAFVKVPRPVDHDGVVSFPFPADLTFLANPAETVIDNECLSSASPEHLLLPTIIFVSQQPGHAGNSASNRLRIFLTSAVDMYAHLGIKDLPVWGVYIMCNMSCHIILAFRSSEDDETYIFDDKPHSYNLSDPFSALQFAIFLLRIRKESPPLRVPHPTYPIESDLNPPSDWVEAPLVVENNCGFASVPWSKWTNASQDPVPDAYRVPLEAPRVLRLSMSTETLYKYCEA